MIYSVLKAPLNPNQPTNLVVLVVRHQVPAVPVYPALPLIQVHQYVL